MVRGLSTRIVRGDKIGILGPNGSGKTTLLRLLLGDLPPDKGEVTHGANLQVAYYDQQRAQLDESRTVQDNITGGNDTVLFNGSPLHIVTYLKHFLFSAERARAPVSRLSGGERNRLMLARLFARPANVLVLDEPTNDLDLETVELLEELLVEFTGTLLLVSHDRDFLDNVTTSTLVLEGDGRVAECVGGYSDWARTAQAAASSAGPAAEARKKPEKPRAEKPRSEQPRRLSWKERRELDELPARIASLEAEQTELHRRLGDSDFYRTAGEGVGAATIRLAAVEEELASLMARWEELASMAE
jgi:ATP-binding cassette subfamily F protein uup